MSEAHQDHVGHDSQHQEVYDVGDAPAATRIAVLENEVNALKQSLGQAQQQANMVPELLSLMARLAARYMPDENGNITTGLPPLTPTQHALFTAASRLLPGAGPLGAVLSHQAPQTAEEAAMAAAHAANLPYQGSDVASGMGEAPHPHPAMQLAADQLVHFIAMQQPASAYAEGLKKRKSDGTPSFGRGAPGQKRYCPLCKNPDGSPTPLAGNHNATCPWCKKCWARKQQVLKVDCPMHNPPDAPSPSHAPTLSAAAMPPMPDELSEHPHTHAHHQASSSVMHTPPNAHSADGVTMPGHLLHSNLNTGTMSVTKLASPLP